MTKAVLAAAFVLAATSISWAQGFNPGTVIGNVYQNPASGCGYGFGFDCYPPGYRDHPTARAHRYARLRYRSKHHDDGAAR
jgi:hypothetical protein